MIKNIIMNNDFFYYVKQKNMLSNKINEMNTNQILNENTFIKLEELIKVINTKNHKLSSQDHLDDKPL